VNIKDRIPTIRSTRNPNQRKEKIVNMIQKPRITRIVQTDKKKKCNLNLSLLSLYVLSRPVSRLGDWCGRYGCTHHSGLFGFHNDILIKLIFTHPISLNKSVTLCLLPQMEL
jgi:hypothetical protein